MAVVVPPLASIVMVLVRHDRLARRYAALHFGVLGFVGLINSGLIFVLLRAVQRALAALAIAVSPPGSGYDWRRRQRFGFVLALSLE